MLLINVFGIELKRVIINSYTSITSIRFFQLLCNFSDISKKNIGDFRQNQLIIVFVVFEYSYKHTFGFKIIL